jgi:hypothetical protein
MGRTHIIAVIGLLCELSCSRKPQPQTLTATGNDAPLIPVQASAAPPPVPVQVTDIQGVVNQMLAAYGPVSVTVQIPVTVPVTVCHMGGDPPRFSCQQGTKIVQQPQTTTPLLAASNIRIVQNTNLTFGTSVQTTLPAFVAAASIDVCNPNPTTGSATAQYSQQIQQTDTVTFTHQVTNTISSTVGGKFPLGGGIDLNASLNVGQSSSSSTANLTGTAITQGLQLSVTEQVPAESHYAIEFMITPTQFAVPFSATVTIDADLSKNDKGLNSLSDIANQASRAFTVDGTITSSVGLAVNANFEQLQFSPAVCPASAGLVVKPFKIDENAKFILKP